jgi:hypothetical protein
LALFVQWFLTVPLGSIFDGVTVVLKCRSPVISLTAMLLAGDFIPRKYMLLETSDFYSELP